MNDNLFSKLRLVEGPPIAWLHYLDEPFSTFRAAETIGDLIELCPRWNEIARLCLVGTCVYGDGEHWFSIKQVEGLWRYGFSTSADLDMMDINFALVDAASDLGMMAGMLVVR